MLSAIVFTLAFTVSAPPLKDAPSIVGEWEAVEMSRGGKRYPAGKVRFIIKFTAENQITSSYGEEQGSTGSYRVDFSKSPAEIEILPPAETETGKILGILKIEGDKLILCYSQAGESRPKKFESPSDSDIILRTLKRIKK